MDWLIALVAALAVVALLYAPGLITCWMAGLRSLGLLALAPAVTLAIAGIGAVLARLLHINWGIPALLGATAVAVVTAWFLAWRWPIITPRRLPEWSRKQWGLVSGVAGGAIVALSVSALIGMRGPAAVLQKWDAVFHMNLVEYIRETGNGSLLEAGAISNTVSRAFYPAAWHDVIALVPHQIPTVFAVNAGIAVSAIGVWVVSFVYLSRVVFPAKPAYAAMAAVLAVVYRAGPVSLWSRDGHLSNAIGIALLPALLAWTVQLARVIKIRSVGRGTRIAVLGAGIIGASLAHPNTLFSYLVLALPVFGFIVVTVVRRLWSTHRQWLAIVGLSGIGLVAALGAYAIFSRPEVQSVMAFDQPIRTTVLGAIGNGLVDTTYVWMYGPNLAVGVFLIVGLWVTLRSKRRRWLAISFAMSLFLYVAAAGDWLWLRVFTGLWYSDVPRLAAMLPVAGIPLCVIGAARLWRVARPYLVRAAHATRQALSTRRRRISLACAIVLVLCGADALFVVGARAPEFAMAYPSKFDPLRPLFLEPAEEKMIERLPGEIDRSKLVLGDPFAGTAFLYSLASQPVVFTHVNGTWDDDRIFLANHFDEIRSNPEVCRIVNKLNVGYFYFDPTRYGDALTYPGLDYGVEPSGIMRLIDTSGNASIYEITACR